MAESRTPIKSPTDRRQQEDKFVLTETSNTPLHPKTIVCKPCERKGKKNVPAQFWCKTTDNFFCSECKVDIHDMLHPECEPECIEKYSSKPDTSLSKCRTHRHKTMEFFCEDHMEPICDKCNVTKHKSCKVVTSSEEFVSEFKNSPDGKEFHLELQNCMDTLEALSKDTDSQIQTMSCDKETALQNLMNFQTEIEERVYALQEELKDKLETSYSDEREKRQASRQKCEQMKLDIKYTLKTSEELKDDNATMMCLIYKGQNEVKACKDLVQEMEKTCLTTRLSHEFDASRCLNSITMGKIVIRQHQRQLPSTMYSVVLSKRRLEDLRKFNIKHPSDNNQCCAFGIVFLSDGRIVVGDNANKNVKLYAKDGDYLSRMTLTDESSDICLIDDCSVAVMLVTTRTICVINFESHSKPVSTNIEISNITENCFGLTFNNTFFVVGTDKSIYIVPSMGGEAKRLRHNESKCLHLCSDRQNGMVFAGIDNKVAMIPSEDKTSIKAVDISEVEGAAGIDVDRAGNVYVCGGRSQNVVQMSKDGTNIRTLLTSDAIKRPRAIAVWRNIVAITSESLGQRNFVHMFQLV